MDRIISTELIYYLRQNQLITKDQHGFLTKKSTSTSLLESLNDWTLNGKKGIIRLLHILTLQRLLIAFPTTNCYYSAMLFMFIWFFIYVLPLCLVKKLNILKLSAYVMCGSLLNWVSSFFLSGRRCQMRIGNCLSNAMQILSGVVQGRWLRPTLFTVFIHDIGDLFSNDTCVKLFADDAKLYSKVCTNPQSLDEGLKQYCWTVVHLAATDLREQMLYF